MVSRNPADAARDPDGATNTATGVRDEMMRETIVRVGLEQSARGSEDDDHQRGVRGVRVVERAGEVFGGNRVDDSVKFRNDDRWPIGRQGPEPAG